MTDTNGSTTGALPSIDDINAMLTNHALRTADHARRFGWKSRWWPLSRDRHPTAKPIVESAKEVPCG